MSKPKVAPHTYSDPYRLGRCIYCDKRRTDKPTKNCR
jgi:hypothetical protein